MLLTEKSKKTIAACRFCSMCRHMCPLGLALGKELNNPRAKALLLQLVQSDTIHAREIAEDIYECCLCNACADNCETGYEPQVFIREVRSLLFAEGLAPAAVEKAADSLLENGTIYGVPAAKTLEGYELPGEDRAPTLLYVGACAAVKDRPMVEAVMSLLKKAKVPYRVLEKNPSTGNVEYDLLGEVAEVKAIAEACAKAIQAAGAKEVIVLNPSDARMMKQEFSNWGISLDAEICTVSAYIERLFADGRLKLKTLNGAVTLHDPERLSRDLQETEPARVLLKAMGLEIKEMWQSRNLTRSTGSEALEAYAPDIVEKTALARMGDAVGTGAGSLIVLDPVSEAELARVKGLPVVNLFVLLDAQTI